MADDGDVVATEDVEQVAAPALGCKGEFAGWRYKLQQDVGESKCLCLVLVGDVEVADCTNAFKNSNDVLICDIRCFQELHHARHVLVCCLSCMFITS